MLLTGRIGTWLAVLAVGWGAGTPGATAAGERQRFLIDISPQLARETAQRRGGAAGGGDFVAQALEQLDLGCDPRQGAPMGRNPYADSVIGRLDPDLPVGAADSRAAIAATLSQDPDFAFAETAGLRASASPGLRYVGWLIPAYVTARARGPGYLDALSDLLPGLETAAGAIDFSSADLDYLSALVGAERGERDRALVHLDAALAKEPRFYNAILFALRLRISAMGGGRFGGYRACEAAFDTLFDGLLALVGLTRCPLQASQSEIYLRRFLADPDHNGAFLASQVYLGVMSRKPAYAEWALERFDSLIEIPCKRMVSGRLHRLVDLSGDHMGGGSRR